MKKSILMRISFLIIFSLMCLPTSAQNKSEKVNAEISEVLNLWNSAAKNSNTDQALSLFDETDNIMLVGSDSGEVFKGKDQIRGWLNRLFKHNSFSWEMNRIDIDSFENTAWVFMDGFMVVSNDKGKTRKVPYRFTGIMVKKDNTWKWRLFNGSAPSVSRD